VPVNRTEHATSYRQHCVRKTCMMMFSQVMLTR